MARNKRSYNSSTVSKYRLFPSFGELYASYIASYLVKLDKNTYIAIMQVQSWFIKFALRLTLAYIVQLMLMV